MARSPLLLLLSLSAFVGADTTVPITWSSIVYTYHGEKTPDMPNSTTLSLTPLGAQQLYSAGSVIRDRYLTSNGTQLTLGLPINGLSTSAIVNSQMQILSTSDEYVVASAQAFMQGLYPPVAGVNGGSSTLGNKSVVNYPLGGYQYPNINSLSTEDYNYIWIAGSELCTEYDKVNLRTTADPTGSLMSTTLDFYRSQADTFFSGIPIDLLNYGNAIDLYEYALYQYNHNSSIYNSSSSPHLLNTIYELASENAQALNTPSAYSNIQVIPGQSLASYLLQQFNAVVTSKGAYDKLTLLFGSFEPMLAFFYLSSLSTSDLTTKQFSMLPDHGSIMAFELFSYVSNSTTQSSTIPFPSTDDLYVRFLFRNGTDSTDPLISYPLFNRGNSEIDMRFDEFVLEVGKFSLSSVVEWCNACGSVNLFCGDLLGNESGSGSGSNSSVGGSSKGEMGAVVAGLIGAFATLVAILLLCGVLALFGFRIGYHGRGKKGDTEGVAVLRRGSSHAVKGGKGGFKGAEKLASDTDLTMVKGGGGMVRHERVGSWELNESPVKTNLDKEVEGGVRKSERVVSMVDYGRRSEDGIGPVDPYGKGVESEDYV
ncbi:histidine acid phosphatase protein [Rutstroemia sp. NJR-2017a BBW]|nr:histidine acid phosphatase protein [Rutstroemia sp. NJR-2017a BBW]